MGKPTPILQLDEARYHRIERKDVPPGWASVPVTLDDQVKGEKTYCVLVAGHVGMKLTSSGKNLHAKDGVTGLDIISPVSGWWMYETKSEEDFKAEREVKAKEWEARFGYPYPFTEGEEDVDF